MKSGFDWVPYYCCANQGIESPMLNQRGQLLRAALDFAGLSRPSYDRALWALRFWLDSWSGIGRVAVGMARQGFDLEWHVTCIF
jgi:hypothetical protein